jgi:membrane associated rhomboid family serine protease
MPESSVHPLESILRLCAAKAPDPWYPSAYAKETGTPRETLDPHLDQLRMAGLIHLTDWVSGLGQGYALTPAGEEILKSPRQLARLEAGKWSPNVRESDSRPSGARLSPWERGEAVRESLLYPVRQVITFVLIIINVVAFVLQNQNRQFRDLLIANPLGLLENQWWRLLTTAFLHAGTLDWPWHLAMNMFALYNLSRVTEGIWGHWRFLAIYLVAAFGGSCLAFISRPAGCIGASGAVCGIFAAWAGWLFFNRQHLPPPLFRAFQRNFLINAVLIVLISFVPGVSWEGHLGGAIAGLAVALCFTYFQSQAGWLRWFQWAAVILVPIVSFGLLVKTMNISAAWGEEREKEEGNEINAYLPGMHSVEQKALKTYSTEVEPLMEQRASRRNSKQVTKVIEHLDEDLQELLDKVEVLQKRKPFSTPFIERARQVRLQLANAWTTLLQLSKECLEKGEQCTKKDEERLKQQEAELAKIQIEWREVLRSYEGR